MQTQFSFQIPIPHLMDFHEDQDFTLALSFLCQNDLYLKYLKKAKRPIILDNSYCELGRADNINNLIHYFNTLHADYLISPDNAHWSAEETIKHYETLTNQIDPNRIIFVIRSDRFYHTFTKQYPNGKMAVPYNYRPHYVYQRAMYDHGIVSNHILNNIKHFLGFNCPHEVIRFKPEFIDTSMPIKLAKLNITYDKWLKLGFPHLHNRHFINLLVNRLSLSEIKRAKSIIKSIKEASQYE